MSRPEFVDALLRPEAYPLDPQPDDVELRQTHISWIFFAGSRVYKVCKPVDFGFLDFTTLEKRRRDCWAEVRLNRRLSPDVYLGVSEIRRGDPGPVLTAVQAEPEDPVPPPGSEAGKRDPDAGDPDPIDYAVVMRRLPDDLWLSVLLEEDRVAPRQIRRIARRVADFHGDAETGPEITRVGGYSTVVENTEENFEQTRDFEGITLTEETFRLVRAYTRAFLDVCEPLFRTRESEDRIRDGHGDLHAEHVSVHDGIEFIDCIEFNDRFRFADVAADLAFLAMDLDRHGRPDLERTLVDEYVERSGDDGLRDVLGFYKCYRAFTRGKVTSFQFDDEGERDTRREHRQEARRYFRLARSYAQPDGPVAILTTGLMASGKSILARDLAPLLDAEVVSSDVVRKELAGVDPGERREEEWESGIYSPEHTQRTYTELHTRAAEILSRGRSVILDASYPDAERRRDARKATTGVPPGDREGPEIPFVVLHLTCDDAELRRRLSRRRSDGSYSSPPSLPVSDGRLELLDRQREIYEPPGDDESGGLVAIDTSGDAGDPVTDALRGIYRRILATTRERCSSSRRSISSSEERSSTVKGSA